MQFGTVSNMASEEFTIFYNKERYCFMRKNLLVLGLIVLFTFAFNLYAQPSSAHVAASTGHTSAAALHTLYPNIGQVPCNGRTDFTLIYNTAGTVTCYASAGYMGVNLPNSTKIWGGNNYGWVRCYSGISASPCYYGSIVYFGNLFLYFSSPVLITQICIGPNC